MGILELIYKWLSMAVSYLFLLLPTRREQHIPAQTITTCQMAAADTTRLSQDSRQRLSGFRAHADNEDYGHYQKQVIKEYIDREDYPSPERISYKINKFQSIFACCDARCEILGWVSRLYQTDEDVTFIGQLQILKTINKKQVYCGDCRPRPGPGVVEIIPLTEEQKMEIGDHRLYSVYQRCECASCKEFTLPEIMNTTIHSRQHNNGN